MADRVVPEPLALPADRKLSRCALSCVLAGLGEVATCAQYSADLPFLADLLYYYYFVPDLLYCELPRVLLFARSAKLNLACTHGHNSRMLYSESIFGAELAHT